MSAYYTDEGVTLHHGDSLEVIRTLPSGSVDSCVTSPPYFGLRDYGEPGQYGLEATPAEYVATMRTLFAEVRRVLADDGTLWLNLGDTYSAPKRGSDKGWDKSRLNNPARVQKMQFAALREGRDTAFDRPSKNLLGIPWRVAFALQDDGWILRNAIIWDKPNAMPESVTDRLACTYEHLFLFSKSPRYWFDLDPIREPLAYPDAADGSRVFGGANKASEHRSGPGSSTRRAGNPYMAASEGGRNPGDVWSISTQPFPEAHFAVMAPRLAERCVLAGCKPGGTVLDPFSGVGTTGMVAQRHGRRYVGIDLSASTLDLSLRTRLQQATLDFGEASA